MREGFKGPWCAIEYVDEPVSMALKSRREVEQPVARFHAMSDAELLEAAKGQFSPREVEAILTEGFFRGLLNSTGIARLRRCHQEADEARAEERAGARFRASHAGMSPEEVDAMLREGGAR